MCWGGAGGTLLNLDVHGDILKVSKIYTTTSANVMQPLDGAASKLIPFIQKVGAFIVQNATRNGGEISSDHNICSHIDTCLAGRHV